MTRRTVGLADTGSRKPRPGEMRTPGHFRHGCAIFLPVETITPPQCRAARGLLGWTQDELAKTARIGLNTLRNFETGKSVPMTNNLDAIRRALEAAGVLFIPENGGGAGLRFRAPTAPRED
ncbi:helix-turn-helix domain-containing protein [Muricoccus radiodurans]|uniref:helix-turn-helix domain-containing protein n=1 Tax=Muricoccus radiodurans TaxID=2231721 RepID=UPI003CFA2002